MSKIKFYYTSEPQWQKKLKNGAPRCQKTQIVRRCFKKVARHCDLISRTNLKTLEIEKKTQI
jgi:hypothetical protein